MLTDSEIKQYVFMCILVLKSYSVYESVGMIDVCGIYVLMTIALCAHDQCIYSVYELAGMRESG